LPYDRENGEIPEEKPGMSDEFSIFGQLNQLNPSGKTRDAKEVPVDKESRRKTKGKKKKKPEVKSPEDLELEGRDENNNNRRRSGKVVDIII
jgi:hypothetical protein